MSEENQFNLSSLKGGPVSIYGKNTNFISRVEDIVDIGEKDLLIGLFLNEISINCNSPMIITDCQKLQTYFHSNFIFMNYDQFIGKLEEILWRQAILNKNARYYHVILLHHASTHISWLMQNDTFTYLLQNSRCMGILLVLDFDDLDENDLCRRYNFYEFILNETKIVHVNDYCTGEVKRPIQKKLFLFHNYYANHLAKVVEIASKEIGKQLFSDLYNIIRAYISL